MRYRLLLLAGLFLAPLTQTPVTRAQIATRPLHAAPRTISVQALLTSAQVAFDKKDYVTAKVLFTQATTLAPGNAVAWAGKARSDYYLGDDTDAVIDYTTAVRYAPTNAIYYMRRGISYDRLGDARHALADYSTAIRLAPGNADAYFNRASFYYNHGQYAPAIPDNTQAIRLRPTWWQAYFDRGEDENEVGLFQAAIGDLTKYIQHTARADCGCAYTERGNAYYSLGEYTQALADYQQAIAIGSAGNAEYSNYGVDAYLLRKYAPAISSLTTAIGFDPNDARAYYYRGLARRDSGDKLDAITDEQQAVQLYTQQGNSARAQQAAAVLRQLQSAS